MKMENKEPKYVGMAKIIRDYLFSFKGKESVVRLTAKEARKLEGMDNFAQNTCYDNVCRAMDYVAKSYVYGNQVTGTERGKGNSTYAIDYAVDRISLKK